MDLTGKVLGKHQVLEEIGRGGMGVVYKGYDPSLERFVAIKILAPNLTWEQEFIHRFLREARAAAGLNHPGIVHIYEVGQEEGLYYFVMEYLEGMTVAQLVAARGRLPLTESLAIIEQVAAALDYAHRRGLVHRDVKASNIVIVEEGRAVLTDFGIVRAAEGTRLTSTGMTLGTPEYMAPEQAEGQETTAASDLYALGIVLYEMLSGHVPFQATTPLAIMMKKVTTPPPPLRSSLPALPEGVDQTVQWALARAPGSRPPSGAVWVAALREGAAGKPVRGAAPAAAAPPRAQAPTVASGSTAPPIQRRADHAPVRPAGPAAAPRPAGPPIQGRADPSPRAHPPAPLPRRAALPGWAWIGLGALLVALTAGIILLANGERGPAPRVVTAPRSTARPTEAVPVSMAAPAPTSAPAPTAAPTPIPPPSPTPIDHRGAWLDTILVVEEPNSAAAITRLEAGEIDLYNYTLSDPDLYARVQESPHLSYAWSWGSYNDLTLNPAGPVLANGTLNPFAVPKIREALNWLIDRDYIVQEIFGGLAVPRYTALHSAFPDGVRMADELRAIERQYAYNPTQAREVIAAEMQKLGATTTGGRWTYNGKPVTLIFLIRTEDNRLAIGDYTANQLESAGFIVDRQYKRSAEASPIWARSDPAEGLWHLYTGGWVTTAVDRDQGGDFSFFYTDQQYPIPLWQAYVNTPEFYDVCLKLWNTDFTTLEERAGLMRRALTLSMEDAHRIWLVDRRSFMPYRRDVQVATNLAGAGLASSPLWTLTARRAGEIGGSLTVATPSIFTDPWNPIAGSNWVYDLSLIRGTGSAGTLPDPQTGLPHPLRIEWAAVVVQRDLPVGVSSDWVQLEFASSIAVPSDAWADWDAVNQRFITVGEKFTRDQTALVKTTVYYPVDLYDTVRWHDGSAFSPADVVMRMILTMDRAKPASAIYDEAAVTALDQFMAQFKGVRIVSLDPLVIETYSDQWFLDAETMVYDWWPQYDHGEAPWHILAVGILAEAAGELAFSADKANALGVEWMNWTGGPSIAILQSQLATATAETYIPYRPTLREYIESGEPAARYANLGEWVRTRGNFWVGTGPYYMASASPLEGLIVLKRFPDYPDLATRWEGFIPTTSP